MRSHCGWPLVRLSVRLWCSAPHAAQPDRVGGLVAHDQAQDLDIEVAAGGEIVRGEDEMAGARDVNGGLKLVCGMVTAASFSWRANSNWLTRFLRRTGSHFAGKRYGYAFTRTPVSCTTSPQSLSSRSIMAPYLGRHRARFVGRQHQLLADRPARIHAHHLAVERLDHGRRRSRRRQEPVGDEQVVEAGVAQLLEGRHVGRRGGAARAGDRERDHLAGVHHAARIADGVEGELQGAGGGRQHLLGGRLIGHVHGLDAGALDHQLGHQVAAGADAGRAVVELAGPRLGVGDQLRERAHRASR